MFMGGEKETRERLLDSARSEFSEKGYTKASLRKICAGAGVTTGALYFFFRDKEDLFAAVVEPPLLALGQFLAEHFQEEREMLLPFMTYGHVSGDHDEFFAALIHHIYKNRGAFILLLTKSQGSRFERCVDEMAGVVEKNYLAVAAEMEKVLPNKQVNAGMLHCLSYMVIDAFVRLITHEPDEGRALAVMSRVMDFLVGGWMDLMLEDKPGV